MLTRGGSRLGTLIDEFKTVADELVERPRHGRVRRFLEASKDKDDLAQIKERIDQAITVLQVCPSCRV